MAPKFWPRCAEGTIPQEQEYWERAGCGEETLASAVCLLRMGGLEHIQGEISGRLPSNHGAGHLNLQKLRHSGLKHQSIEFGSATATGNLREEISERRVSEKGSSNFSV